MFDRKATAQKIAEYLRSWFLAADTANYIGAYQAVVPLDEAERRRMYFSLQLFPISVTYTIAEAKNESMLMDATRDAHDLYLSGFRDKDQIVRIGDYIIWRVELEALAHLLRENFSQLIVPSEFEDHQM